MGSMTWIIRSWASQVNVMLAGRRIHMQYVADEIAGDKTCIPGNQQHPMRLIFFHDSQPNLLSKTGARGQSRPEIDWYQGPHKTAGGPARGIPRIELDGQ